MGKSSRRRLRKKTKRNSIQAQKNSTKFQARWDRKLEEWLNEIGRLGWKLRDKERCGKISSIDSVFAVLDQAIQAVEAQDERVQKEVRDRTIDILTEACCYQISLAAPDLKYNITFDYDKFFKLRNRTHIE